VGLANTLVTEDSPIASKLANDLVKNANFMLDGIGDSVKLVREMQA